MMSTVTARGTAEAAGVVRDPERPARLLRAEHDALLPILQRTPEPEFGRPTACPGWSVRDVLAHCSSALAGVTTDRLHAFTPELNEIDMAERREWPLSAVLSELAAGYPEAGPVIGRAGGRLDGLTSILARLRLPHPTRRSSSSAPTTPTSARSPTPTPCSPS
jgi:uncharacterized protein (TIGR03083 family)